MRIGQGFDAHAFATGRRLVIGGVEIPYERGLAGHSDADVLIHAVCDALLGAAGLGDIGKHFPDTDITLKDIDSRVLLRGVTNELAQRGFSVHNVDATVITQVPKLAPYIDAMCRHLADDMAIDLDRVNIKATTTEHMGFTGREEGVAAMAVAVIDEPAR